MSRHQSEPTELPPDVDFEYVAQVARERSAEGWDEPIKLRKSSTPPKSGPKVYFLRLKGGATFTMTILGKEVHGFIVHWARGEGKSKPCIDPPSRCPGCKQGLAQKWKGYLHCFNHNSGQEVFLELTPGGFESLVRQLPGADSLRGNRIQVKRAGGDKGRLIVSVLTHAGDLSKLPPEKDPEEDLLILYNFRPPGPNHSGPLDTYS